MGSEGETQINKMEELMDSPTSPYHTSTSRPEPQHIKPARPDITTARPTINNSKKYTSTTIIGRGKHSYTRPRTDVFFLHAFVCGTRVYGRKSSGYCHLGNLARYRETPARESLRIMPTRYRHSVSFALSEIPVWIRSSRLEKIFKSSVRIEISNYEET